MTPHLTQRRPWKRRGAVLAAAVAVSLLFAQDAYAANLPDSSTTSTSTATTWTFSTSSHYWSIVGVATAADWDVKLYDGSNTLLASSTYGTGVTDWIAINSNLRPLGAYSAAVSHWAGTGPYYVEQRQGHTITTLPTPDNDGVTGPSDPDLAFASVNSQDVLSVSDIYLTAGQKFWVNVASTSLGFYLLESNPSDPSTFIKTRAQAIAIPGTKYAQGCTMFTANYTGWHGLVEVSDGLPHATSPQEGEANALDGYDAARPNTCPQRNFPEPTPAGP